MYFSFSEKNERIVFQLDASPKHTSSNIACGENLSILSKVALWNSKPPPALIQIFGNSISERK